MVELAAAGREPGGRGVRPRARRHIADRAADRQEWWSFAPDRRPPEPLFAELDPVYCCGEFTFGGLWTVTQPPTETHHELIEMWELYPRPIDRWCLSARGDARVFEVHGAADWARLVTTYPRIPTTGHDGWELPGPNQHAAEMAGVEKASGGRAARLDVVVMPDWQRVGADFDGVHFSWAGMLGAEGHVVAVPELGPRAVTMLRYWRSERTLWLGDVFGEPEPLGEPWIDPHARHDDPIAVDVTTDEARRSTDLSTLHTLLGRDPVRSDPACQTRRVSTPIAAGPEIVAIPGPTVVPDRVLAAMRRPMLDIYAGELTEVIDFVFDTLPSIARTTSRPFVPIGNGHAAWEMALTNTLSRGDKVLVLDCGRFAEIWGEMASFDGLEVELIAAPTGWAVDPAVVEEHLANDTEHAIKAVLTVHVDTASSVRNDIVAIRRAIDAAGHPALYMVDGIASLGCEHYEMDEWGIDVTVGASQKGLMTPPGVGIVWAGPRALAAHEHADLRTRYWDWTYRTEDGPYYLRFCGTPPVSHLFGLHEALQMISEEGLEPRWRRHRVLADAVRAAVEAWATVDGLSLLALDPSERANSVTTIGTGRIDAAELSRICRESMGVTLGVGIGSLAGESFRIGHMGHVNAPMVLGVLGAVEAALDAMRAPLGGSGVAAAAASLGQALAPR